MYICTLYLPLVVNIPRLEEPVNNPFQIIENMKKKTYLSPQQPLMVSNRPRDTKRRALEPPERKEENRRENSKDDSFCFCCVPLRREDEVVQDV